MTETPGIPIVLALSGSDPSGGAGIQADIESLLSHGCHCAPVITAVTVQDTQTVYSYAPLGGTLIMEQARAVLEDMPVAAIKIGMLGSSEAVEAICGVLQDYPNIPVVLDPIVASGNGATLAEKDVLEAIDSLLLPHVTVLTPNSPEARILAPAADNLDACAMALLDKGCEFVLITGTHENTSAVTNSFYGNHRLLESYTWERLNGSFHGSGCTLAASIAGLLAQGLEPLSAVHEAQAYTWETLARATRLGMGQALPNRLFWAQGDAE